MKFPNQPMAYDCVPRFGLRWQSAAATPLSGGREAFKHPNGRRAVESGVALRFPPQSKTPSVPATMFSKN
jgi:hypothetical protein